MFSPRCILMFSAGLLCCLLHLVDEASGQIKITVTPKVVTSDVKPNSVKAKLEIRIKAVDQGTKQTLFTQTFRSHTVTLPKNIEVTIPTLPPPPLPPTISVEVQSKGKYTGNSVTGSVKVKVTVGPKSVTLTKSFNQSVTVN